MLRFQRKELNYMRRRKNRSGNPAILAVGLAFVVVLIAAGVMVSRAVDNSVENTLQAMQQSSGMVH